MAKKRPDPLVPIDAGNLRLAMIGAVRRGALSSATPSELERRSGVLQQTIDLLVKGKRTQVRASNRDRLATALGVFPDWLSGQMVYPRADVWGRWSEQTRNLWLAIWTAKESKSDSVRSIADHVKPQHILTLEDLLDLYDLVARVEGGAATEQDYERLGKRFGIRNYRDNEKLWMRRLWRAIGQLEGHMFFGMPAELADEIGIPHPQDLE